jgi:hypothetical protein
VGAAVGSSLLRQSGGVPLHGTVVSIEEPHAEFCRPTGFDDCAADDVRSCDLQDTTGIDTPDRVIPKASQVTGVKSGFTYTVPANGIVVLILAID